MMMYVSYADPLPPAHRARLFRACHAKRMPMPLIRRPGDPLLQPGDPFLQPGDPLLRPGDPLLRPGDPLVFVDPRSGFVAWCTVDAATPDEIVVDVHAVAAGGCWGLARPNEPT